MSLRALVRFFACALLLGSIISLIFDSLQAAGVSWKIYSQLPKGYTYADAFSGFATRYANTENIVTDPTFTQFISDAQNGQLPSVAFLEKPDADEKPESNDNIQYGVRETRQLINARQVWTIMEGLCDHLHRRPMGWDVRSRRPPNKCAEPRRNQARGYLHQRQRSALHFGGSDPHIATL
jgi:hypothetical protein